jgi:hypothetical protein
MLTYQAPAKKSAPLGSGLEVYRIKPTNKNTYKFCIKKIIFWVLEFAR